MPPRISCPRRRTRPRGRGWTAPPNGPICGWRCGAKPAAARPTCCTCGPRAMTPAWLDGRALHELPAPARTGGIALDDADAAPDETALFHLLNAAREARLPVLLAARTPPARWPVRLPDLPAGCAPSPPCRSGRRKTRCCARCWPACCPTARSSADEAVQDWLLLRLPRSAGGLARGGGAAGPRLAGRRAAARSTAGSLAAVARPKWAAANRTPRPRTPSSCKMRGMNKSPAPEVPRPRRTDGGARLPPRRAAARAACRRHRPGQPGAVHQPRAVLARLQPPRAWRRRRIRAIRCWSGCASCRSAPPTSTNSIGARRRPDRPGQGRRHRRRRRTAARRRSSWPRSSARAESLLAEQQRVWRELRGLLREAGIEVCEPDALSARRRDLARRLVHGAGVPGADAAGDRSGASVPVHPQHGPGDGAAAACARRTAMACAR